MKPLLLPNRGFVLGGGEIGVELLVEGLIARGIAPAVVLPTPGPLLAGQPVERQVAVHELGDHLRRIAPACTSVHTWSVGGFAAARSADLGLPVVLHALVPNPSRHDPEISREAAAIICNSRATAARFPRSPVVRVVPNGVPEPQPVPAGDRIADPDRRTIALVGNICPRKGQLDSLPALIELVDRRPDVEVLFMGHCVGMHGALLRRRIADRKALRIVGFVPRAGDHLLDVDLVLAPSWSEGFGRMAAEALRAGASVLARPVEGLLEVLDGLDDPWLPPDPMDWADRIETELDRPAHTQAELRGAGARFDVDRWVDAIIGVHRGVSAGAVTR